MPKSGQLPPLSEAQLEIMNVVWDRGEVTVGEVWNELASRREVARNTILTMITRLMEKGWLRFRTSGNAYRYRATAPREATLGKLVERFVETAFRGSAEGLVAALLDGRGISKEEADRIRQLIDNVEQSRP